jgi:hypothetical protein
MTKVKVLNLVVVKTYGAIGFNIFSLLLGFALNHKCGLMALALVESINTQRNNTSTYLPHIILRWNRPYQFLVN